jgi:hypothetical protein
MAIAIRQPFGMKARPRTLDGAAKVLTPLSHRGREYLAAFAGDRAIAAGGDRVDPSALSSAISGGAIRGDRQHSAIIAAGDEFSPDGNKNGGIGMRGDAPSGARRSEQHCRLRAQAPGFAQGKPLPRLRPRHRVA